jgi:hypothetical protein
MGEVLVMKAKPIKKDELVWQCSCGEQEFWLHMGGEVQCTGCHGIHIGLTWVTTDEKAPEMTEPTPK